MALALIIMGYGAAVAAYIILLYLNMRDKEDNREAQSSNAEPVNIVIPQWALVYAIVILAAFIPLHLLLNGTFEELVFTQTQVFGDFIPNPLNPDEKLFIQVKISSSTFAANTPMQAEVIIALEGNYRNWADWTTNTPVNPDAYQVLFLGTTCNGIQKGVIPELCHEEIPRLASDHRYYYNTTTLIYSRGGQLDVILVATGNSTEQRVGHGFIEITSIEGLNTFLIFKVTFIIAIIAAVFAALSVYEQHRSSERSIRSSGSVKK